jgi:hypothetical protein
MMNDVIRDCTIEDLKKQNQELKEEVNRLLKQLKSLRKILKSKGYKDPAIPDPIFDFNDRLCSDIFGDLFKGGKSK